MRTGHLATIHRPTSCRPPTVDVWHAATLPAPDTSLLDHVDRRILLVEDNPGDALLTAEHLQAAGQLVNHTVGTAAEAVEALAAAAYDVVLLDLGLPDADGLDALGLVRAAADIPIIVLTGAQSDIGIAAVKAGAQDYLQKGTFDGDRLGLSVALAAERHDALQLQRNRAKALDRANERLSRFVAIVAHDLRSPLVNAEQWARLASTRQVPDLDDALERITRNLGMQFNLIDSLLTIYRDEELPLETVDTGALVQHVVAALQLGDVVTVVAPLPPVSAAPDALTAVLRNLCRNAVAHATVPDRDLRIRISARTIGSEVTMLVDDNGPGVAPDARVEIFERGHTTTPLQAVRSGEDVASGFGLGLAGARDQMEAMGGLLWVEESSLGGASFVMALQGADAQAQGHDRS